MRAIRRVDSVAAQSTRWTKHARWEQLRATLADEIELEDPRLGTVSGVDAHVALYREQRRFSELTGVTVRRQAHNQDVAFISYDVYLGQWRTMTVVDQLSVRDGRIRRVLAVSSEWPSRKP